MADPRTWDMGDPEPPADVLAVYDHTDPTGVSEGYSHDSARWGRTHTPGEWKGYKDGKTYLDWDELTRRWGPLTEVTS